MESASSCYGHSDLHRVEPEELSPQARPPEWHGGQPGYHPYPRGKLGSKGPGKRRGGGRQGKLEKGKQKPY